MSCALWHRYVEQGYVVLPGFKTPVEISDLRSAARCIVDAFDPQQNPAIFTTREQDRNVEAYFMGSGDKVRCFLEEEALDADGRLKQDKSL